MLRPELDKIFGAPGYQDYHRSNMIYLFDCFVTSVNYFDFEDNSASLSTTE